jgi:hypothetical protein
MDSSFYDMIFKRKSFHRYGEPDGLRISPEELEEIKSMWYKFTPLFEGINTKIKIVPGNQTSCNRGEEYCILIYSEKKPGYLQNIGYIGEQLDLWLTARNIGPLWFGVGRTKERRFEGLDYVIMMAIRKVDETKFRVPGDLSTFIRVPVEEFWEGDVMDGITEVIRLTPTACNIQPWKVINKGNTLDVYRYRRPGKHGIIPPFRLAYFGSIDIGIFMLFLDICLEHQGIAFDRKLTPDDGNFNRLNLNAVYSLNK